MCKIKEILHKYLFNGWFKNGIHSLLDARVCADIIYHM